MKTKTAKISKYIDLDLFEYRINQVDKDNWTDVEDIVLDLCNIHGEIEGHDLDSDDYLENRFGTLHEGYDKLVAQKLYNKNSIHSYFLDKLHKNLGKVTVNTENIQRDNASPFATSGTHKDKVTFSTEIKDKQFAGEWSDFVSMHEEDVLNLVYKKAPNSKPGQNTSGISSTTYSTMNIDYDKLIEGTLTGSFTITTTTYYN